MLKKNKLIIITILILFQVLAFISCQMKENDKPSDLGQLTEQEKLVIQELNQWLYRLYGSPLTLTDNDLISFDQLKDAKLVALGEATHGTKEFFQMKHRIFQFLVEYYQHKAFGFEADFAESLFFDDYICQGLGDLEELMKTKMHFWTWRNKEVKQLLEWMKDYNIGRSEEEKIHYYGFDCQYTTYQTEFIQDYLEQAYPVLGDTAVPVLEQVKNFSTDDYRDMTQRTYNDIKSQLESLENQFDENKDLLIANSSTREYEIHKQLLHTFKQAFIVRYHSANFIVETDWRDQFMAENALWIADFLGQNAKITLWAHNGHVAKDPSYGGSGSMGHHLNQELSNLYQVVGFSFSLGSFTAVGQDQYGNYTGTGTHEITTEPQKHSINLIFHRALYPNFTFHLDAIPANSQWDNWLKTPRPFLSIGAAFNGNPSNYYRSTDIRAYYNWIIHFDRTTASELIPQN